MTEAWSLGLPAPEVGLRSPWSTVTAVQRAATAWTELTFQVMVFISGPDQAARTNDYGGGPYPYHEWRQSPRR